MEWVLLSGLFPRGLLNPLSCPTWDYLPTGGLAFSGLGPPLTIIKQLNWENVLQTYPQANLVCVGGAHFINWGSLFSNDFSLWQVQKNLSSTIAICQLATQTHHCSTMTILICPQDAMLLLTS